MDLDSFLDDCLEESMLNKEDDDILNDAFKESRVIIPYEYLNALIYIPENMRMDWYNRIDSDSRKLRDGPKRKLGSSFDSRKKPLYPMNRIIGEIFSQTINIKYRLTKDQSNKLLEVIKPQYKQILKELIKKRLEHDSDYIPDKYQNCSRLLDNKL